MADALAMAEDLLDRVVTQFTAAGVALPAARYLASGDSGTIAHDYEGDPNDDIVREALMVNVDWVSPGQAGSDQAGNPAAVRTPIDWAQFAVTVVRAAVTLDADGNSPTVAAIQADGQTSIRDVHTLHRALRIVAGSDWVPKGAPVALGRTVTVGPTGRVFATVGTIQTAVGLS
jgi:hypothetical protein